MDKDRRMRAISLFTASALVLGVAAGSRPVMAQQPQTPQATVPEIFTLMGEFVRVAYNNQGFVTMGYRMVQESQGEKWIMLEVGITMRSPSKNYTLKRGDLSIKTPDGAIVPLATQKQYAEAGYLPALTMREQVQRDSINYFPVEASRPCAIRFFAALDGSGPQLAYDEVELSTDRGCLGRLFFNVPDGIKVGQYWLNVSFGTSQVQVPFRILTKEEEKQFRKSWEDIKKQHEASLKK
jgi:hypothetical protein